MAKKEALIDLQHRLADRLKVALTEPVAPAWLAVLAGKVPCLFPLVQSGEIFPLTTVARVPYVRPWFAGVLNLRGSLFGVVDLAGFMGHDKPFVRSEQAWPETRLVTFNAGLEINCALLVDGLMGLRRQEAFSSVLSAPPASPPYWGNRFLDAQGQHWQEIDLRVLAQTPAFLKIGI